MSAWPYRVYDAAHRVVCSYHDTLEGAVRTACLRQQDSDENLRVELRDGRPLSTGEIAQMARLIFAFQGARRDP